MTDAEDVSAARLLEEFQSLGRAIEDNHPGCLRRSDRWSSGDGYIHGILGGRPCPASGVHRRRREVLSRYFDLVSPVGPPSRGAAA